MWSPYSCQGHHDSVNWRRKTTWLLKEDMTLYHIIKSDFISAFGHWVSSQLPGQTSPVGTHHESQGVDAVTLSIIIPFLAKPDLKKPLLTFLMCWGRLQSMGWRRMGHDLETEQQQQQIQLKTPFEIYFFSFYKTSEYFQEDIYMFLFLCPLTSSYCLGKKNWYSPRSLIIFLSFPLRERMATVLTKSKAGWKLKAAGF